MELVLYPDDILRRPCKAVEKEEALSPEFQEALDDMIVLMRENSGAGLSAPQVGINKRFFVMAPDIVFINPEIIKNKGTQRGPEGCLSFPDMFRTIKRSNKILVKSRDRNWKRQKEHLYAFDARVVQHEIDHLDGRLFIDYE